VLFGVRCEAAVCVKGTEADEIFIVDDGREEKGGGSRDTL
jgi:hypothetical protein